MRLLQSGTDKTVAAPQPTLRSGADPSLLPTHILHFATYAAGLALGMGALAPALELLDLDTLQPFTPGAHVAPGVVAQNLLYAASFARCQAPAAAGHLWPEIAPAAELFLDELGRRLDDPSIAGRTIETIDRLVDEVCRQPATHRENPVGVGAA